MHKKIFFLKSGRCAWGRCIFCGYGKIRYKIKSANDLKEEFNTFFDNLNQGHLHIKVFGSGSFLDENQVPKEARRYFIKKVKEKGVERLTIESRPEFITDERVKDFAGIDLDIGVGLEVADNVILDKLSKGFHRQDLEKASELIHSHGFNVRAYLLVNPPFVEDIRKSLSNSIKYASRFSDSIVLINLLPHENSELFRMWLRGEWNFLSREEFLDVTKEWKPDPKIELDVETFRFIPRFPKELRENLDGVGEKYLTHPHFEVWQDYLLRWYHPPESKEFLLFLPCSYRKPYSMSNTHKKIINKLSKLSNRLRIHEVMLSNAGVVPREFEDYYPFNSYNWDEKKENPEIRRRYIEVTGERIESYLRNHSRSYQKIFCFLKYDSESYKSLEGCCENLKIKFSNLLSRDTYAKIRELGRLLQSEEALNDLYEGLENEIN